MFPRATHTLKFPFWQDLTKEHTQSADSLDALNHYIEIILIML